MKRSKAYFCHKALSFRPIHMKQTPKCSLFNSLSSDMVTNVALTKVCALRVLVLVYLFIGLHVCVTNISQKLLDQIA